MQIYCFKPNVIRLIARIIVVMNKVSVLYINQTAFITNVKRTFAKKITAV